VLDEMNAMDSSNVVTTGAIIKPRNGDWMSRVCVLHAVWLGKTTRQGHFMQGGATTPEGLQNVQSGTWRGHPFGGNIKLRNFEKVTHFYG
jgi:hypothetical protein